MTQDDKVPNVPDLALAQQRFLALYGPQEQKNTVKKILLESIKKECLSLFIKALFKTYDPELTI